MEGLHVKTSYLEEMVIFARVVETGSLTRAAKAVNSTRSAVSKAVGRLEAHLGTLLLHRTTRALSTTVTPRQSPWASRSCAA
jgi:DNA-binding transcriptional LysR family regulator